MGDIPVEESLHVLLPSWTRSDRVVISLNLGQTSRRDAPDALRREAVEARLSALPADTTWILSDGSAEGGVSRGGGALITTRSGESREIRVAAGSLCSSTRAELMAIRAALEEVSELADYLWSYAQTPRRPC